MLRLIFEGLGASLEGIDTSKDEWERQLKLDDFKEALKENRKGKSNRKLKTMADSEYNELRKTVGALSHKTNPNLKAFWQYRHSLEHRMSQSVDYGEFYPVFETRPIQVQNEGEVDRTVYSFGSQPRSASWCFDKLYKTTVAVYGYYLNQLKRLASLPTFKPPK